MRARDAPVMLAVAWLLIGSTVQAQSWPARPMRVIVPFPAGGGTDLVGRLVAAKLADDLAQPAVVDNRPGAGGVIGADIVAKATADGYTTGIATSSTHPAAVVLRKDVPGRPAQELHAHHDGRGDVLMFLSAVLRCRRRICASSSPISRQIRANLISVTLDSRHWVIYCLTVQGVNGHRAGRHLI